MTAATMLPLPFLVAHSGVDRRSDDLGEMYHYAKVSAPAVGSLKLRILPVKLPVILPGHNSGRLITYRPKLFAGLSRDLGQPWGIGMQRHRGGRVAPVH